MTSKQEVFNLAVKAQDRTVGWPYQMNHHTGDAEALNIAIQAWDDGLVNMAFAILNRGNPSEATLCELRKEMEIIINKKQENRDVTH